MWIRYNSTSDIFEYADDETDPTTTFTRLPLKLTDADIDSSAAISWSKVSKTGSSLADLATRSAEDLSSGILPDARLNTYTNRSYSSGNYTGSGSMTWTVDSGDVLLDRYVRVGPMTYYSFYVYASTVGGTPDTTLKITLPDSGGYETYGLFWYSDNGTVNIGLMRSNGTALELSKLDGSNWTASTNNTAVRGLITYFAI